MAQINCGAATETEMKEKKARVEDALHATRAAVEDFRSERGIEGSSDEQELLQALSR